MKGATGRGANGAEAYARPMPHMQSAAAQRSIKTAAQRSILWILVRLVELRGIEPLTSSLRTMRSPN